jgi:hypothetical protein
MEFYLLSIEIIRFPFSEHQLVFVPVVEHELLIMKFEDILVVFNYEAGCELVVDDVGYLLIVEL